MNQCRECLAELPPGAVYCPKCGRKLGPSITMQSSTATQPAPVGNWRVAIVVFGIAGVMALLIIVGILFDPARGGDVVPTDLGNLTEATPSREPAGEPIVATAEDLGKAYEENGLTARDRFEGRPVRVTGAVLRIGSNLGEPTISLQSGLTILAAFADPTPLKALKSGEQVTITCEALSEVASVLGLRGCVLNTQGDRAAPANRRGGPQ